MSILQNSQDAVILFPPEKFHWIIRVKFVVHMGVINTIYKSSYGVTTHFEVFEPLASIPFEWSWIICQIIVPVWISIRQAILWPLMQLFT